jgi:hypothetical protein
MTRQIIKTIISENQYDLTAFANTYYEEFQCILLNIYNSWAPNIDDSDFIKEKESLLDYITLYYNSNL